MIKPWQPVSLTVLLLFLSACSAPTTSNTSTPTNAPIVQPTLASVPVVPTSAGINAPLVDSPALTAVQFLDEHNGWGVTETQIVRTDDGGVTWYNVTPPDITKAGSSVKLVVMDNNHVWTQIPDYNNYPNSGTLYRTTDAGLTWTSTTTPFSEGLIHFLDENNGWALATLGVGAGSNAVAVYQTTDGGSTWAQKFINDPNNANAGDSLPLSGLKFGLTPLNMQTAWIYGTVYSSGTVYVYRTDDGGTNWSQIPLPLPQGAENGELGFEQIQFVTPTDAFLTMRMTSDTTSLAIYTSNDAGKTWTLTPTLIPTGGSVNFLSATEAVIYNGQQFYVTRDAAQTWSTVTPDINFGDTFAMMDFVNLNTGWAITADGNNHRSFYKTDDGGATWFPIIE